MNEIFIKCKTKEELFEKGDKIHKQLVGNIAYICSDIVLHLNEKTLTIELYIDRSVYPLHLNI